MPRQRHYYGLNNLHYFTRSTYRRVRLFDSERFKRQRVRALNDRRTELSFKLMGYVLNYMPNNPVARKRVDEPGEWSWSSWRFYFMDDPSILSMDRML